MSTAPATPDLASWFDERVRALTVHEPPRSDGDGAWRRADVEPPVAELEALEDRASREEGAPPRVALTWAVGWIAGMVAGALAVAAIRERVVLLDGLEVVVGEGGWVTDLRIRAGRASAPADHPLAGAPGVDVLEPGALPTAWVAAVTRLCTPTVVALARRSRRSRAGLWAQIADSAGLATECVAAADTGRPHEEIVHAVDQLLRAPGAPWPSRPALRSRRAGGAPLLIVHRGSCCLAYRCAPYAHDEPATGDLSPDLAAFEERFVDDGPGYCSNCLFRPAEEVDERALWWAARSASVPNP